jgi:hypothetical protein
MVTDTATCWPAVIVVGALWVTNAAERTGAGVSVLVAVRVAEAVRDAVGVGAGGVGVSVGVGVGAWAAAMSGRMIKAQDASSHRASATRLHPLRKSSSPIRRGSLTAEPSLIALRFATTLPERES